MKSFYDYSVPRPDGTELDLSSFKGKVVIVVNTATGCGFTPHYEPLEKLYEEYHDKGLEILDIPCNQFAGQTPSRPAPKTAKARMTSNGTSPSSSSIEKVMSSPATSRPMT